MFLLALSLGLREDPSHALMAMLARVCEVMEEQRASEPLRVSLAVTDGSSIWALRCSSDNQFAKLVLRKAPYARSFSQRAIPWRNRIRASRLRCQPLA